MQPTGLHDREVARSNLRESTADVRISHPSRHPVALPWGADGRQTCAFLSRASTGQHRCAFLTTKR